MNVKEVDAGSFPPLINVKNKKEKLSTLMSELSNVCVGCNTSFSSLL